MTMTMKLKALQTIFISTAMLLYFSACLREEEFEPELSPETFDFATFILDLDLPNELVAKTGNDDHAKFVYEEWSEVKEQVMIWNENIAGILYEMDSSSLVNRIENMGIDWLPINAESEDTEGFNWKTSAYQAKFFQGNGLVEVGVDVDNRYINWYSASYWYAYTDVYGIQQSLDRKRGAVFYAKHWEGEIEYNIEFMISWELIDDKLVYTTTWYRERDPWRDEPEDLNWELNLNGSGILTNKDDCSDRYFWNKEGNGVFENNQYRLGAGDCKIEIVTW